MAKSAQSPSLLKFWAVVMFLLGEMGGLLHRVMFRPTPHRCLDLPGTYPPACAHTGRSLHLCTGRRSR